MGRIKSAHEPTAALAAQRALDSYECWKASGRSSDCEVAPAPIFSLPSASHSSPSTQHPHPPSPSPTTPLPSPTTSVIMARTKQTARKSSPPSHHHHHRHHRHRVHARSQSGRVRCSSRHGFTPPDRHQPTRPSPRRASLHTTATHH